MACAIWRSKIAAYADAELPADEMRAMGVHLRDCSSCNSDLLGRVQLQRATQKAGKRYTPSLAFRQRVETEVSGRRRAPMLWIWMPAVAATVAVLVFAFLLLYGRSSLQQRQSFSELTDLHVATLASSNPVDVVSTDRHTVKPWFQGKLPFTFNLPELGSTPFTLEGGRISYLDQAPGAQLIYTIGNHRISVFMFQNRNDGFFAQTDGRSKHLTFNMETWTEGDLRFFAVGDANPDDIHKLSELLKLAAKS
jgi:anti-sigma factor RsiW